MRFSIWSSLIVITDAGGNPETGWLRSYLVCMFYCSLVYRQNSNLESSSLVLLKNISCKHDCLASPFAQEVLRRDKQVAYAAREIINNYIDDNSNCYATLLIPNLLVTTGISL